MFHGKGVTRTDTVLTSNIQTMCNHIIPGDDSLNRSIVSIESYTYRSRSYSYIVVPPLGCNYESKFGLSPIF